MNSSIAALVLVLATPIGQAGQPSQLPPQVESQARDATAQRRLVVTYSDGRTSTQILRPRGGFWTPRFPRQANPPQNDGLSLSALQVDFETGRELVVTVSLKYGTPHQKTVPVTTVQLGTEPVRVNDLERYGVDPIVLSLDDFSSTPLVQPTVTSASPMLDVTVDLMRHDVPIYKIDGRPGAIRLGARGRPLAGAPGFAAGGRRVLTRVGDARARRPNDEARGPIQRALRRLEICGA